MPGNPLRAELLALVAVLGCLLVPGPTPAWSSGTQPCVAWAGRGSSVRIALRTMLLGVVGRGTLYLSAG